MRRAACLFFLFTLIFTNTAVAQNERYDAIIVRSDLPYDWTVAQAYSQRAKIPIITTSPEILDPDTREQLKGFIETGHNNVLVFGGEAAISSSIEAEMVDQGFVTHRIREVDRYGTSARVAVELYGQAETVVLVDGEDVLGLLNSQMAALQIGAPILFIKRDGIPQSVKEAMKLLGTKKVILIPTGLSETVISEIEGGFEVRVFPLGFDDDSLNLRVFDIAVGLALGALLVLILRHKKREKVPYNVLTEDEERIIRAIEENGGEIGQDVLYEKTGFSRPKISRLVSQLVERDLLVKTQFKKTFKLKMKKELIET